MTRVDYYCIVSLGLKIGLIVYWVWNRPGVGN
jgi:hypothetical protein